MTIPNKIPKEIINDYDKKEDILYCSWGKTESSLEIFDGKLILDFNKKAEVVGFEIFNFRKELKKGIKLKDNLLKTRRKRK